MSTEHLMGDVGLVLEALMGTADQPRQEAEAHLRKVTAAKPAEVLLVLAQIGAQGVGGFQLDHRFLALLLLKRLAFQPLPNLYLNESSTVASAPFDVINERVRGRIEVVICAGVKDGMDTRIRKGLGNCAAVWAQESAVRHRPFLALPPVLLGLTASPHPFHRFTPFQLLDLAPALLVDSVTDPIPATQLAQILLAGLNDPSGDVRVEAMKALRSIVMEGLTGKEREQVGPDLILETFKTLPRLPVALLSHALLPLVELSSLHPMLFVPSFNLILPYLLSLLSPPASRLSQPYMFSPYPPSSLEYDDWLEISGPAGELLMSLIELKRAPTVRWENGRAIKELVGLLLEGSIRSFEADGEDCKEWLQNEDLQDEDDNYSSLPEEMFDRLAQSLGGSILLPSLSEHVQPLLQRPEWRCRYASLITLGAVAEGCGEEMTPRVSDILKLISPMATDPHPRVRYAFIHLIGRFCTDLDGIMQSDYPTDVLTILTNFLRDSSPRVRAHAGGALCNFFNKVESGQGDPYIAGILRSLLDSFPQGPMYLQEQWIATLSSVSMVSEYQYRPFYREVMDLLFGIMRGEDDESRYKVVGQALECASLAGLAVEKPMFSSDAVALAEIMIKMQNDIKGSEDPRAGYLMEAWSNTCRILGDDFAPFMRYVIPPLLQAASWVPKASARSEFSVTADQGDEVGDAHTAEMDEKALALEHLTGYATIMKAGFQEWVSASMQLGLDGLVFKQSESVREAAAFLIPVLMMVAKDAKALNESAVEHVFKSVINAMATEADYSTLASLYRSLTETIAIPFQPLSATNTTHFLRTTSSTLSDLHSRRHDRRAQEQYMDEGDRLLYLDEQREENVMLDEIGKCLIGLSQVMKRDRALEKAVGEYGEVMRIVKAVRKDGLRIRPGEGDGNASGW